MNEGASIPIIANIACSVKNTVMAKPMGDSSIILMEVLFIKNM